MTSSWLIWLIGAVLLVGAGFAAAFVPRWRAGRDARRAAWAGARSAIDVAAVSRDAAATRVAEAEQLFARAEAIAAGGGGCSAAGAATDFAERADQLWRAAARG